MTQLKTLFCSLACSIIALTSCSFSSVQIGERYALVYGVGNYANISDLPFAINDGTEMQTLLNEQGYIIINAGSTASDGLSDLQSDLAAADSVVGDNDILLFYFAGHGLQLPDRSDGLIAFTAFEENNNADSILTSDLIEELYNINALHSFIIIDACNSANAIDTGIGVSTLPQSYEFPVNLDPRDSGQGIFQAIGNFFTERTPSSLSVIASAGASELAYEWSPSIASAAGIGGTSAEDNGVFTGFLLESAAFGDANRDGVVSLSEAYNYVFTRIDDTWNEYHRLSFNIQEVFYPHISGGGIDPVLFPK